MVCAVLDNIRSIRRLVACYISASAQQSEKPFRQESLISSPDAPYPSKAGASQPQRVWGRGAAGDLGAEFDGGLPVLNLVFTCDFTVR